MAEADVFPNATTFMIGHDHPALAGHFPGRPIVPGVVILDEVRSAIVATHPEFSARAWPVVKFHAPLLPDEWATIEWRHTDTTDADTRGVVFRVRRGIDTIASGQVGP